MRVKNKLPLFVVALFVASPIAASAATDTKSTTINATVASVISVSTSSGGTVGVGITPTAGGSASSVSDAVTVSTNNASGYTLVFSNTDTNTVLNGPSGATIAAHTGTWATPTTLANNSWGVRIDGPPGFGTGPTTAQTNQANLAGTWAGVPSSAAPQTITINPSPSTATTTFWYGVKADTTKVNGVYTDSVTYTATTN